MTVETKAEAPAEPIRKTRSLWKRSGKTSAYPFWILVRPRVGVKRFLRDLWGEIDRDQVSNSAAVMAYYSMLAIFPAAILCLSLLPYLPIPDLEQNIIAAMYRAMPMQAAELLTSTVSRVVSERRGGLLSFGLLGTIWAASTGLQAVMDQIHSTYEANETRPYWKRRLIAIGLVFAVGILVVGAFALVIVGGILHERLVQVVGQTSFLPWIFAISRWLTVLMMMLAALSLLYHLGPNVRQRYRFITPGGLLATALFVVASILFRTYVENFGSYEATYGSLGAAIVLLLWLYVGALVILVGSEVNGVLEGYVRARAEKAKKGK